MSQDFTVFINSGSHGFIIAELNPLAIAIAKNALSKTGLTCLGHPLDTLDNPPVVKSHLSHHFYSF